VIALSAALECLIYAKKKEREREMEIKRFHFLKRFLYKILLLLISFFEYIFYLSIDISKQKGARLFNRSHKWHTLNKQLVVRATMKKMKQEYWAYCNYCADIINTNY